jgi:hypothetical protein
VTPDGSNRFLIDVLEHINSAVLTIPNAASSQKLVMFFEFTHALTRITYSFNSAIDKFLDV